MEDKPKYGRVLYFQEDENDDTILELVGSTYNLFYCDALNVYNNFSCCESRLIKANSIEELNNLSDEMIQNMKDKDYCEKHVDLIWH